MGYCPNCGNWVDEGDTCGFCGGSGSYSYNRNDDDSLKVRNEADQKINRAKYIINSEMSYDNANLRNAMNILDETKDTIDKCLRGGRVREETSLRSLKMEIDGLKEKIRMEMSRNENRDSQTKKQNDFPDYPKEKLITITATEFFNHPKFYKGMRLKLIKEPDNPYDKDAIGVYSGSNKIGYVANSQKTCCSFTSLASELKHLPDVSYVEYLYSYDVRHQIALLL